MALISPTVAIWTRSSRGSPRPWKRWARCLASGSEASMARPRSWLRRGSSVENPARSRSRARASWSAAAAVVRGAVARGAGTRLRVVVAVAVAVIGVPPTPKSRVELRRANPSKTENGRPTTDTTQGRTHRGAHVLSTTTTPTKGAARSDSDHTPDRRSSVEHRQQAVDPGLYAPPRAPPRRGKRARPRRAGRREG